MVISGTDNIGRVLAESCPSHALLSIASRARLWQIVQASVATVILLCTRNCSEWDYLWRLMFGIADAPFQYRMLGPLAIRSLTILTPLSVKSAALVYLGFCYFWLFVFVGSYCERGVLGVALAAFGLWFNEAPLCHISDVLSVVFWIGLCHCILSRKYAAWFFLFAVSITNHENALLLLPAAFLVWRRDNFWRAAALVASSAVLWAAIKYGLAWALNCHGVGYDQVSRNLIHWPKGLLAFGGLWVFALAGFRKLDYDRKMLLVTVPVFVVVMFRYGCLDELRIYSPLLAVLLPAMLAGLGAKSETRGSYRKPGAGVNFAPCLSSKSLGFLVALLSRSFFHRRWPCRESGCAY